LLKIFVFLNEQSLLRTNKKYKQMNYYLHFF
jgi:hypothetical protein